MSNIRIFAINLERRHDRLEHIESQLKNLGLEWQRFVAHDMHTVDQALLAREVAPDNHIRYMGPGSQCCALTNFDIYRQIISENLEAAMILQDDVILSREIIPFVKSFDWLPDSIDVVQFEKYGKPRSARLLGPAIGEMPVRGRALHRLYSRTGGAACYLIRKRAVERILAQKTILRMPIDHFLFSPNISPIFHELQVAVIAPALARQKEDGFESDLHIERNDRVKRSSERLRRLWQDFNRVPQQIFMQFRGASISPFYYKE